MAPRASTLYLGATCVLFICAAGLLLHARARVAGAGVLLEEKRALVRSLSLTDLCLCTEANYTRHPAVTDLSAAFQDSPMSFEHFPSGGLLEPPAHLAGARRD